MERQLAHWQAAGRFIMSLHTSEPRVLGRRCNAWRPPCPASALRWHV